MEIAVESIASNLDISGIKSQNYNTPRKNAVTVRRMSLPKMTSHSKAFELRRKIYLTITLYLCYFGLGYHAGIVGPTLAHLQYIYNANTAAIANVYLAMNMGYFVGSTFCAVVFDRINHEIQLAVLGIIIAVATALLPWMPNLYYFYSLATVQYSAHSAVYSSGQAYIMKVWKGHRYIRSLLQCTHCMWSIGAFASPFCSMPYLVDINSNTDGNMTTADIWKNVNETFGADEIPSLTSVNSSENYDIITKEYTESGVTNIRYIYGFASLIDAFAALNFFICFMLMGPSHKPIVYFPVDIQTDDVEKTIDGGSTPRTKYIQERKNTRCKLVLHIILLSLVSLYSAFFFWHELGIGGYLSLFAVKGLHWTAQKGALVASIYFGFHGLGRITGIFVTNCLTPSKVIVINMFFTSTGIATLIFSYFNDVIVLTATAVIGFFMASTFPSVMLWTSNYIPLNGMMGGLFMASAASGCVTAAPLIGFLFQEYSHMWVIYISLLSSVLCIAIFAGLLFVGKMLDMVKKKMQCNFDSSNGLLHKQENGHIIINAKVKQENGHIINGKV